MPTTPYAKILVSVNGGGNVDGGIDIPSQAVIQLSPESTVGWLRARWEWSDYPEGWDTPSGWTLDANGAIFSSAFTPASIVFPDASDLWGVWMPRLLVNEQLDDSINVLPGLLDQDLTALSMLSVSGLRSSGAREQQHFTTATTRIKNWLRSYQRNLLALENPHIATTSNSTTPVVVRRYPVPSGGVKTLRAVVKVRNAIGTIYGEYEVKGGWNRVGGTLVQTYVPVVTTVAESDAGLNVTLTLDGDSAVLMNGVGLAATDLIWEAQEAFF